MPALSAIGALVPTATDAAVPIVGGQAPGYYRIFVGRYEVTALLDGTHGFHALELAVHAKPGEVKARRAAEPGFAGRGHDQRLSDQYR